MLIARYGFNNDWLNRKGPGCVTTKFQDQGSFFRKLPVLTRGTRIRYSGIVNRQNLISVFSELKMFHGEPFFNQLLKRFYTYAHMFNHEFLCNQFVALFGFYS